MSTTELYTQVKELKELMALEAELKAEIEALKEAVRREMGESELIVVGEFTVRNTTSTTSPSPRTA